MMEIVYTLWFLLPSQVFQSFVDLQKGMAYRVTEVFSISGTTWKTGIFISQLAEDDLVSFKVFKNFKEGIASAFLV